MISIVQNVELRLVWRWVKS